MTASTRMASGRPRRDVLKLGSAAGAAFMVAGCTFFDTDAVQRDGSSGRKNNGGAKGSEAPALAKLVKSGDLPPVEDRMPANPLVVEPVEEIGDYGGMWNSAMLTQEDVPWLENIIAYEPLVRWKMEWTKSPGTDEIIPNIAEEFEELEDGSVFQFKLREGLKWSDGTPCTADDLVFTFEDVHIYDEMHPDGLYSLWTNPTSGEPGRIEKVDDNTVRYVFDEPKPGFLNELAAGVAMVFPKHYLGTFHPKHNPDVDELVAEANLNDWIQLFEERRIFWSNPEMPCLHAWVVVDPLGQGTGVVAERNPYYWKVDRDGSQLPYIDKISCEILLDVEVEVLKVTNGELDMQMRNFSTVRNRPVIARSEEEGDYKIFTIEADGVNNFVVAFNQVHPDPRKRELYRNKDFRIGLSHAIDRQRIIEAIYGGQGEPWQCAPLEGDPVYDEEMAKQFTEYDPDLANEYLNKAGFTERNGDDIRLGPGGEPISVEVHVAAEMQDHVDALEFISEDWRAVGVDTRINRSAETLYWERVEANQTEASTWTGGGFEIRATQGSNHYYIPTNPRGSSRYGHTWARWYISGGSDGDEPPEPVRHALELFDEMRMTYDAERATELGKEILAISKEQFFYIGICTPAETYGIVKNDFHNVPDSMPGSVGYKGPGPSNPPQYFMT